MRKEKCDIADFHAHILPCADHGSSSLDMSLSQLKIAKKYGVTRIIATPHFYPHFHTLEYFLKTRDNSAKELLNAVNEELPKIKLGAEILLCDGLEHFDGLEQLCFKGTNYLLLELPFMDFKYSYCETVSNIIEMGYEVILAHADRYHQESIEAMMDYGVTKLQLNASSITKVFASRHLSDWIKNGYVISIGSDIHELDSRAYKSFFKAKNKIGESLDSLKAKSDDIWDQISF